MNQNQQYRFLGKDPENHIMQLYQKEETLVAAAVHFIRSGLEQSQGVVVVATASHRDAFWQKLKSENFDVDRLIESGRLQWLNAILMVDHLMRGEMPDKDKFLNIFPPIVKEVCKKYEGVHIFSEMADLLCKRSNHSGALCLEEYWHSLAETSQCKFFCAFFIMNINENLFAEPFHHISNIHSKIIDDDFSDK
jgi:hypothetical protein